MRALRGFGVLSFAFLCFMSVDARAETEVQVSYETVFEEATQALRENRFPDARDLFRRAHAERPTWMTAFNLAVALRGTGESVECTSLFDSLLGSLFGDVVEEIRAQAFELRAECAERRARIVVTLVGPQTANLRMDEHAQEASAHTEHFVDSGRHILRVEAEGWQPFERVVDVASAEVVSVRAQLALVAEVAEVASFVLYATEGTLEVDSLGESEPPMRRNNVEVGIHEARLRIGGEVVARRSFQLVPDQHLELTLEAPRSGTRRAWIWVVVGVVVASAAVGAALALRPADPEPVGTELFPRPYFVP